MSEKWTLDPDGVALTIHGGTVGYPRWEYDTGVTFTPGARKSVRIEPTSADGEVVSRGARANAQIGGRLILSETSDWADRSQIIGDIQAVEEVVATEGVVLEREFPDATSISYDVVGMETDWDFLYRHERLPVSFEVFRGLGYGTAVTAGAVTSGTALPLARGTITHVGGATRARGHVFIEDLQSQHHMWALTFARYAGSTSSDQLYYEAEALTPGANASVQTFAGAYGGATNNIVRHATPAKTDWDLLVDSGALTHTESLNVWARAAVTSFTWAGNAEYRLSYRLGNGGWTALEPKRISWGISFQWLDLGHIPLDGEDRWQFRIFVRQPDEPGSSAGMDCVVLAPSRHSAEVGGDIISSDMIEAAHSARDHFGFTGNLGGRTPTIGSAWATGGVTTDFTGSGTTTETVQRATGNEASPRRARFGPDMTACAARVDVQVTANSVSIVALGLRMNSVSADNDAFLVSFADVWFNAAPASFAGGTGAVPFIPQPNAWYTLFGAVVGDQFIGRLLHRGAVVAERRGSTFGLTPSSGKAGIRDWKFSGASTTRLYRRPVAWVPNVNPAMSANQALEIAFDEAMRIDSGVRTPRVASSGLWLPESGREGREVEWGVLTSRGNPRLGMGDLTGVNKRVTVSHTPQWPVAPEDPTTP